MEKKILFFLLMCLLLAACTGEATQVVETSPTAPLQEETSAATAVAAAPTRTKPPATATLPDPTTWTVVPTLDRTRPPIASPTPERQCNQAAAGSPIDVTIPDGTVMASGEAFTKTWRLENVGTCTWTRLYALTFFSGNSMNATQVNYLPGEVPPGSVVDLSVDMEAPLQAGVYQSNWMLSDPDGNLFGIGPHGDAPFWVQIQVVPIATDTPQPSATPSPTPVVYLRGEAVLVNGDGLDLDSGALNPEEGESVDLLYEQGGEPAHVLVPMNGSGWMVWGETEPTFPECNAAALTDNGISFEDVPVGTYLCYRTSNALPGWLRIGEFDAETAQLALNFLTWAVP